MPQRAAQPGSQWDTAHRARRFENLYFTRINNPVAKQAEK